jgi:hypothetical protein
LKGQIKVRSDNLAGIALRDDKSRAKDLMTLQDFSQSTMQRLAIEHSLDPQGDRNVAE